MARLNINNPKDAALLKSKVNKSSGKSLYDEYMSDLLKSKPLTADELIEEVAKLKKKPMNSKKAFSFDGKEFDSIWEKDVYEQLWALEQDGYLEDMKLQQQFICKHNGVVIVEPTLDFTFKIGEFYFIADAKSEWTSKSRGWVLVNKIMKAFHKKPVVFYQDKNNVKDVVYNLIKGVVLYNLLHSPDNMSLSVLLFKIQKELTTSNS